MSFSPPAVLAFAASDPTSGAGLQADVLAVAGMGAHPLCAVTALTVQDSHGVYRVQAIAPGTRWEDVPETWSCPDCAASKAEFEMEEI